MRKPKFKRPNVERLLPHEHQLGDYVDDMRAVREALAETDDPRIAKALCSIEDVETLLLAIADEMQL